MSAKPSDILNRAAEIIIERGHCKGHFEDRETGAVCLMGALSFAQSGCRKFDLIVSGYPERAHRVLQQFISMNVHMWNDRPETTEAMAIGALHEAALLAKEAGE